MDRVDGAFALDFLYMENVLLFAPTVDKVEFKPVETPITMRGREGGVHVETLRRLQLSGFPLAKHVMQN